MIARTDLRFWTSRLPWWFWCFKNSFLLEKVSWIFLGIVKLFIHWTWNLLELNRAMAKVPVIDLSPFLRAQEKAPRRLMGQQTKIFPLLGVEGAWTHCGHCSGWHERVRGMYILIHTKLFFCRSSLAISTFLSLLISESHSCGGQMLQSVTYLRTVGWEKWHWFRFGPD